ncbi:Benzoyl-CoA reductase, bzd-type, Q subunit [uncultured Desulfobacterium sp.]|uniref:Benzoyl-CoA reductase, bzd-type, Q subunit n=1 Tax=uncultured Desulfobacterium sp. TaxID=201089 RepID=A0A445MRN2_9BACT|nr:Benzoyl-CoA reductase, bzd-type, Q subunit [uncultured Desulfobacterium sp.]
MEEKKEYFRWVESTYVNPDIDWKKAEVVSAGIDVGSVSSQMVVMCDGQIYAYSNTRSGSSSPNSAKNAMELCLKDANGLTLDNIHYLIGTGYGRVNIPFAQKAITEISCHGIGANFMYGPTVKTLLDMGGQDCKALRLNEKGKCLNFLMNDKCAAGTGRGMEVIAEILKVPVTEIGDRSFDIDEEPPPVSSTCVVFAKSEATGLLKDGWSKNKVLAAYCAAMAGRVVDLLNRIEVEKDFAITGGIAKNKGVAKRIEKLIGVEALVPKMDTQIAGALGAAIYANALYKKAKK